MPAMLRKTRRGEAIHGLCRLPILPMPTNACCLVVFPSSLSLATCTRAPLALAGMTKFYASETCKHMKQR